MKDYIILSLEKVDCDQIFLQNRSYFLAKSNIKDFHDKKVIVYSARKEKKFVGTFDITEKLKGTKEELINELGFEQIEEITNYFHDTKNSYVYFIENIRLLNAPLSIGLIRQYTKFQVPQCYSILTPTSNGYYLIDNWVSLNTQNRKI